MIKIVITGIGKWGENHLRIFKNLSNEGKCSLVAISDVDKNMLNAMSKKYGIAALDIDKAISSADAIIIASPASTHYELIKKCVKAGKDVFVEKPICLNLKEAAELKKLAEKQKNIVFVGLTYAYNDAFEKLEEVARNGELGRIKMIKCQRRNIMKPRSDCGVIHDYSHHDIFMCNKLFGKTPREVMASAEFLDSGHEYEAGIRLRYGDGESADIIVDWISAIRVRNVEVVGDKKSALFDDVNHQLKIADNDSGKFSFVDFNKSEEPLVRCDEAFLECVKTRQKPLTDISEGLKVFSVADAAIRSLKNKKFERVEEI